MTLLFIRLFFVIISGIVGHQIGIFFQQPWWGVGIGCLCGVLLIALEANLRRVSVRGLSSMVFGLLLGVFMAKLISDILSLLPLEEFVLSTLRVIFTLIFSYLGAVMALRGKDEFNIIIPYVRFRRQDTGEDMVLLDTSALIDGRIADVYKTNFLSGRLVIPRFVLEELQKVADSKDAIKRERGRRGMEILRSMQKDSTMNIVIHENDIVTDKDVDAKLIRLAKVLGARICTADFNLNRIASIQGVEVLNIDELAAAVKTVVVPGEEMTVHLIKEGKEPKQAVAYIDDGTMVVVNDAKHLIGQTVKVTVSSALQTQGGRMIFAKVGS